MHLVKCDCNVSLCAFGRPQAHFDEVLNLRPNAWIALDGGVPLEKEPVVPRVNTARIRFFLITEIEIAENRSPRRIGRDNFRTAVNYALILIKINCFDDVSKNNG